MREEYIKSLSFFVAAGIVKKEDLKYLDVDTKKQIVIFEDSISRARFMKKTINSLVEMCIWKDARFVKN